MVMLQTEEYRLDITDILEAVITIIVALVTTFVIPWLKTKCDIEKLKKIKTITEIVVAAAEQMYKESGMGVAKKQYVINYLKERGIKLDLDELNAMIESSVYKLGQELTRDAA